MEHTQFNDLPSGTRGRISGLLEAANALIEQSTEHHDDKLDDERNSTRNHHQACHNTCHNMAAQLHRDAINLALEEAETNE